MKNLTFLLVAAIVTACSGAAPDASSFNSELEEAFASGRLRIEVNGLKNEPSVDNYSVTYRHKATVVVLGDSRLARRPFWVLFSIVRVSGGNPEDPRDGDWAWMLVRDGVGKFDISGGYLMKSSTDRWTAEVIEVTPIAVTPLLAIKGTPVRECTSCDLTSDRR